MIRPGFFGKVVHADNRRIDFDYGNEQLLFLKKDIDVLFIGDSITQLWDIPAYIGNELFIVNRAIGGDNSTYLLKRFDADCVQLSPKKCVMMIGTNDVAETNDDLWAQTPGKPAREVMAQYKENIRAVVDKCEKAGISLTLCSVIPSDSRNAAEKQTRFAMTAEMNEFLKALAMQHSLDYVDYFPALCLPDGKTIRPEFASDGIHPNAECYAVMAEILKKCLFK